MFAAVVASIAFVTITAQAHSDAARFTECLGLLESMAKNDSHVDPFMQQILKDQTFKRSLADGPTCPEYWKMSPAKTCVHVFTYNVANWTESRKYCHRFNGDLVTIGNDWMNFWLQHQLIETNVDEAWIGMSKVQGRPDGNAWNLNDKTPVTYKNFQDMPADVDQKGDCVSITLTGYWFMSECGTAGFRFICETQPN